MSINAPLKKYEAILLEMAGPGLSDKRCSYIFQILDQIQPHMGVFAPVMKRIRDELFDAVYSDQYTGTVSDKANESGSYIERIPYFYLIRRVYDDRDNRSEELQEQFDAVKKRLFEKQCDYEASLETAAEQQLTIEDLKTELSKLHTQVANKKAHIARLNDEIDEQTEAKERVEHDLKCDIAELKEELEESLNEAAYLRQYKTGYAELDASFIGKNTVFEDMTPLKKKSVVATKRSHLVSSIESASKMEEQLLTVQNMMVEEYDKFIEEDRLKMDEKYLEGSMEVDDFDDEDAGLLAADLKLSMTQRRFRQCMADMRTEVNLLCEHKTMLQEQMHMMTPHPSKRRSQTQETGGDETTQRSVLPMGVEEEEDPKVDPFIPQERIFSKYAAMMYTSDNNGNTFHEFKDAYYCASCGEKSVLCPHKILSQEHIFPLPPGSTHLKVSRPKVRINQQITDNVSEMAIDGTSINSTLKARPSGSSILASTGALVAVVDSEQSLADTPRFSAPDSHLLHTVQRLWDDFKSRTDIERGVSRQLSQSEVVSLMEQFAGYIVWVDDYAEDDDIHTILDNVYTFSLARYLRDDIMYLAMHDLLTSISQHSASNKMIQLFMHVLIGNYDGAVFRYLLVMFDFIDQIEWQRVEDFRAFAAAVYPFLSEDDLETLHMGFTSFSENKVSKQGVMEYIIYIILKYREPRFLQMETKLMNQTGHELNILNESEFAECAEVVLSVTNERLRRRLFLESQLYVSTKDALKDGVPILRLAQLTSYLELLQIAAVIKETVVELVHQARDSPGSTHTDTLIADETPEQDTMPTMTRVKRIALNIDRRYTSRDDHLE